MLLKWFILDVSLDINSQVYSVIFIQYFTFTFSWYVWKYFSIFFSLKYVPKDGRTCILTNHSLCVFADNFIFCSTLRLTTLGHLRANIQLNFTPVSYPWSVYRPSVACPLSLLGDQEARRTVGMSLLMLQVTSLLLSKPSMWQTGKHPVQSGFVPSCLCGTGDKCTLPGDTPDWSDLWAFPPEHHFRRSRAAVLTTPAVQNLERMRDEEPKRLAAPKRWVAIRWLVFRTKSAQCVQLLQGSVPRVSDPVSRVRSRLALLPKASSLCFVCPLPAVPPPWCTWSWMPLMCPYREGCNSLVDIG